MKMIRTRLAIIGFGAFFLSLLSPYGFVQNNRQERSLETVKALSGKIDQFVKSRVEADRKFVSRSCPKNGLGKNDWEWREIKAWDEADAFFEANYCYREVGVYIKNASAIYASTGEWSDSGDWYLGVDYYYDNEGRLLQIAADFRSATDGKKVLDFQYFNEYGGVFDHIVEYYDLRADQKLTEKPDMQIEIHEIPVFLRVADLPVYSLLKAGLPQRKN